MLRSNERIRNDGWVIKEMESVEDGEVVDEYFVLKNESTGQAASFDEVRASGGLIQLSRDGNRSVTYADELNGNNKITGDGNLPVEIVKELQEIGPW